MSCFLRQFVKFPVNTFFSNNKKHISTIINREMIVSKKIINFFINSFVS